MDNVEAAVRSMRHTVLDPRNSTSLLLRVVYVWRRDGIDYQMQATFLDMSAVHEAVAALETIVTGATTTVVGERQ
jgi:hypothetical protein